MTTSYRDTFITASPDSKVDHGAVPTKAGSIAQLQHALLAARPYALTSDDLLFEVHAIRSSIADVDRGEARATFFAKSQACLRASPLVKQYGWGVHHDSDGRIAIYGIETAEYQDFTARADLKQVAGIRSKRA